MRVPLHTDPRIREVDTEIFELRYFAECMACGFCNDSCCQYGADVNVLERDRILAEADRIQALVPSPVSEWFDTEEEEDPEYPGGRFVRTGVVHGACVFKNRKGRGCLLHAFALKEGRDYHPIKPMVCWMFPVIYDQGILRASIDVRDGLVCVDQGQTLYRGVRNELAHHFGPAFVAELDAVEKSLAT